jgi:outer membrane protein assembly factor BamB
MEGKLVVLATDNGSRLWAEPLKATEQTGGGVGCAPASTSVAIYGSPAVAGDLVYVSGYNGKIYAISSSTRLSKDKYLDEKDRKPIIGGPLVAGGTVYIGSSDGLVYALDAISLDEKWKFQTGDKIWSTPAIAGDTLFISSFDKKLYAIDITTGKKKWEKPFETEGAIVVTPVVYNNAVYFGSFDRHLYAVNITDGKQIWKFPANEEGESKPGNWFWAKPVIYNNTVYAPCLDGKVYILNAETGGEVVDAIDLEGPISSSPVLMGNSVIVATEDGVVYTLDTDDNQKSQLANLEEKINNPLAASQGIIYIHTAKDALYAVDVQSGAIREFNIK